MTTALDVQPLTVRAVLFGGEAEHGVGALVDTLHERNAAAGLLPGVRGLSDAADRAVITALATAVEGFLGLDLVSLIGAGWSKHAALGAAARRTRRHPGSEEIVALATHTVTSAHHPQVDVLVDGVRAATVDVDLTLVFRITGLVAVVRDGRLTAVRAGDCAVEATLAVRQIVVAARHGRVDLPATLRLRAPVELLPPAPGTADAAGHPGRS
ncbi:hypothetical protein ACWCQL_34000 [Streptomyces sp. NPDC002073]|uniref:hypothetical protein n=1 Tax=Streptomyces sp. NBC_00239 TaxID=2903640 RepID=UPI002E2B111A|nr:hypothetical protein [Streptomyces sp. NBC_00239]